MKMKTIATPVAELLAQLHDHAAGIVKLIEAIPALKGDDLPQIVNRVHMLGKLAELEARYTDHDRTPPNDAALRQRVRLLADARKAEDHAGWDLRTMSNRALAERATVLASIVDADVSNLTDAQIENAIGELQRERRERKRAAKQAANTPQPGDDDDSEVETIDDTPAPPHPRGNGVLHIVG